MPKWPPHRDENWTPSKSDAVWWRVGRIIDWLIILFAALFALLVILVILMGGIAPVPS